MNVFITKAAKYLPNAPVENDDMEQHLGMVDGQPSKARRIILRRNGIRQRYYALDSNGNVTHTNVEMAAKAVQELFDAGMRNGLPRTVDAIAWSDGSRSAWWKEKC